MLQSAHSIAKRSISVAISNSNRNFGLPDAMFVLTDLLAFVLLVFCVRTQRTGIVAGVQKLHIVGPRQKRLEKLRFHSLKLALLLLLPLLLLLLIGSALSRASCWAQLKTRYAPVQSVFALSDRFRIRSKLSPSRFESFNTACTNGNSNGNSNTNNNNNTLYVSFCVCPSFNFLCKTTSDRQATRLFRLVNNF